MLGSHNSFTYLKCLLWWLRPFLFMARCQYKDIYELYRLGVRLFDLRLKFIDGIPVIAHGLVQYPYKKEFLQFLNEAGDCYCRVLLEYNSEPDNSSGIQMRFINYCMYLEETFPNIKFFGGLCKWNWNLIYKFKTKLPSIEDKYSSTTWLKLDDWWPWLYAHFNNKKNIAKGTNKDFLFIDFV